MNSGVFTKRVLGGLAMAALAFSLPFTTPTLAEEEVVATVNGKKIMASQLKFAYEELKSQLGNIPEAQQRGLMINYLVDRALIIEAAKTKKIDDKPGFAERMSYYKDRAYRDAYFTEVMMVNDEEAKSFYEKQLKLVPPREEIRARHILVKTEDEAKELVKTLEGGKDFAELAKEKSIGPSKARGGDLGYFAKGDMVPAFFEAADALKKGGMSAPLKTKFGWHVIKLEDRRMSKPPAFATVSAEIKKLLRRKKAETLIRGLRKDAKIELASEKKAEDKPEMAKPAEADKAGEKTSK